MPIVLNETAWTLDASYYKGTGARSGEERTFVAIEQEPMIAKSYGEYSKENVSSTLKASVDITTSDVVCTAVDCRNATGYIVRRLTPLEAERLQGYPDGWTDIGEWVDSNGKKRITSDSARYKALGNSIAIPPWLWVCDQIGQFLGEDKTMASLFDGIGGFPLIWSYLYGKENVLFCSEIEEFPIAVTKYRFGDD